ncbi:DUF874 domain-containing protein [uncultured Sulfitobacter sp.]|uniref:GumC family protein n=1 Tax=uncultured Sulfitobacter sp. TaxID=191468 RepID=UPI0026270187|nr:DUF874 domain-containing protein [uncultured Sulfitobacter sp.]
MGTIYSLADFVDMLRRRAWMISMITMLGCLASVLWALSTPHLYSASEVIQIEQPKIDDELAPSTVAGSSARRLQLIEQQLMARNSLQEIIEKYDLYADAADLAMWEKVDVLRRSVFINGVAAVREGFADDGTIAVLTISAEMETPELAQAVAHEFADRTRSLSSDRRKEQARETLEFFQRQEDNLIRDIAALEEELTAFRGENDLSIAGSLEFRREEIGSLNASLLTIDREIIDVELALSRIDRSNRAPTVQRQQADLETELTSLQTQRRLLDERRNTLADSLKTTPEVERALANYDRRLDQLQGQLDVISTRRNEAEVGFTLESAARGERLITLEEAQIPDYPVTASRKRLAAMGGVASVGIALILAFLLDLRRPIIRTARQMERETGLMPVASVPQAPGTNARRDKSVARKRRRDAGKRGRAARMARKAEIGKA